jgi:hypothetical protein
MTTKDSVMEEAEALKQRIAQLGQELGRIGPVMRGSLVVIGTRNKQPYFSVNIKRRTHLIYLGKRREEQARQLSENYHQLQQIVEEMTLLNMRLLKLDDGK